MKLNYRTIVLIIFINLMALFGCQDESQPIPVSGSNQLWPHPLNTSSSFDRKKIIVSSNLDVTDFSWSPNGQVYYAVSTDVDAQNEESKTKWYAFDREKNGSEAIANPWPGLNNDELLLLKQGQVFDILNMTISTTRNKVIYTRLPDGYERSQPSPHDYIDPAEIWVTEDLTASMEEGNTYPLLNDQERLYDCGIALSADSRWLYDETLVFGSCYFPFGIIRVYFLADLLKRNIQFLDFEDESGEYVSTEEITMAHHSPSLAFSTNGAFWVISIENGSRKIPLKLTELDFVFDDRPAVNPVWSGDDQWIYYWTYGEPSEYDENGFVKYQPWWLEKIRLTTRERVVVLSEKDLVSLLGFDMYRRGTPLGFGNPWKLSPDEKSLLLFLSETVDTESTLFLISWP